ncbi:ribosomal protein S6 kinase delta-1-like isoform X2 [Vespa mandarinia]|uniref:ribosomal protein S6 kinase delta-1-like isoform X2 n=1 Tax=Vespa mandarinia TaxID=7446 RepID=UPI001614B3E5|nr:ribosomal protein S6 kinase delta-1-like isoform X2 [Vespa mandarinia]
MYHKRCHRRKTSGSDVSLYPKLRDTEKIYLKASREEVSKVSVWKRYNDFKKLHSALYALHAHFQIKDPFPPFTKSKFFGRFEVEVVQERKNSALKFLDFIGKHRCLYTSDIFIKFFENSSLNDSDTINGRSQSVGSDTSEDDHNIAGLNDAVLTNNIEIIESARLSLGNIIDLTDEESRSFDDVEESPFEIAGPLKEEEEEEEECRCVTAKGGSNNGFVISSASSDGLKLDDRYNKHENNKRYELKKTKMLKIKNPKAIQDCTDLAHTCKDITHYIVVAAAYISAAFKHEAIAEYEEAFAQYKMGISTLLLGVETDPDDARKIIIKEKVSKYLDRAEKLYNRYLNWNISLLNKPTTDLKNYKVLNIIDSLMLVKDLHTNNVRIVKSIEKPLSNKENPMSDYILRGEIPFMVRLHGYIETEATVFLILEYVKRGRLWDFIIKNYKSQDDKLKSDDDYHSERIRLGITDECQNTFEGIYNDENERKLITERFRCPYDDVEESTRMNLVTSKEDNAHCQIYYNVDEICGSDVPTTQLLEKAQKLLQSVNATLRRSNFVVNRSNESKEEFICSGRNVSRALKMSNVSQFKESSSSVDNNLKRSLTDSLDYSFANAQDNNTSSSNSSDASTSNSIITDDIKQEECYSTYENNIGSLRINDGIDGTINDGTKCFISKNNSLDEGALWEIPEEVVCRWAAEILLALEALHQQGVIIFDLKPEKILLDEHGRATLTYIVPYRNGELTKIREQEYSSPELYMFSPTTCTSPATDIWNYGIILYELLTGIKFRSLHGEPFRSHSVVSVPNKLSDNARSLLLNILKYDPEERLTISDIKKHYFFEKIDWSSMVYSTI